MKTRQKIRLGITFSIFLLFPVIINYLSPVLILSGASEGIINGSFIVFCTFLLVSLFFGQSWCGWVCPASGMQDACRSFRQKKAPTGIGNTIKFIVWFIWLGMIVYFFIKSGGVNSADFLYNSKQVVSILDPIIVFVYFGVVLTIFAMTMIFGQRAFCKYLCWMGPFMIVGNKIRHWLRIPGLYLALEKSKCIQCGRCSRVCPMNIDVMALVNKDNIYSPECIMCFNCADICPKGVISSALYPGKNKGGK